MLGLLVSGLLPVQTDFGITLPMGYAGHRQVHAHLGAFAVEVGAQAVQNPLVNALGHAHHMLGSPAHLALLLGELRAGDTALGALLGGHVTLMNITANRANPLLHSKNLLFK